MAVHLLALPHDLLVKVLTHLCDGGCSAGAVDLLSYSRTCRIAAGRSGGRQLSAAEEAARVVIQSARGAPPKEDENPVAGPTRWMRELYVRDCSEWDMHESGKLNLRSEVISKGPALVGGIPHLVTGGPSGLMVWMVSTDRCAVTLLPSVPPIVALAVVHTSFIAAAEFSNCGSVWMLDLDNVASTRRTVQTACAAVTTLECCGGVVVAAGEDTCVACFDGSSGEMFPPLLSHAPGPACIAACGVTVAVGCSGRIHVFEQGSPGERPELLQVLRGDDAASACAIALLPAGILAAADWFGEVHVWSQRGSKTEDTLGPASADGPWVARLSFDALGEPAGAECSGLSLAVCHDRFLATGHRWETSVAIWNCFDGTLVARVESPDGVLCFGSVCNTLVALSGSGVVAFWRPRSWRPSLPDTLRRADADEGDGKDGNASIERS